MMMDLGKLVIIKFDFPPTPPLLSSLPKCGRCTSCRMHEQRERLCACRYRIYSTGKGYETVWAGSICFDDEFLCAIIIILGCY